MGVGAVPVVSGQAAWMPDPAGREALADALFSASADIFEVLNKVFTLPSAPSIQGLAHAVGRVKEEMYALLDGAVLLDEAASGLGPEADTHRLLYLSGQVIGYQSAAEHLVEALVDAFGLWREYDTRCLDGHELHERAVQRYQRIKRSGGRCDDPS